MTLIDNCLKYVESRIELYENRSFCALKNVLKTSTKAKKWKIR